MIGLLVIVGTLALVLFLTALVVFPFLFVEYLDFRRSVWIAVSPAMIPVTQAQLPPAFAGFLGAVRPVLEEAGFNVTTISQAPAFGAGMAWWHVLMLNRTTGERAAVTCLTDEGALPGFDVALALECSDGRRAASTLAELLPGELQLRWDDFKVAADAVRKLVEEHRERAKSISAEGACKAVMPADGHEVEWVQSRVAMIAAAMAEGRFRRDASGDVYRPTRRYAMRLVARNFRLNRRTRRRPSPPGFAVLTPGDRS